MSVDKNHKRTKSDKSDTKLPAKPEFELKRSNALTPFKETDQGEVGNNNEIDLAKLPGIQEFSERAVLGLLKTFAQLQRDRTLVKWKADMRLGAGVGDFEVSGGKLVEATLARSGPIHHLLFGNQRHRCFDNCVNTEATVAGLGRHL